jgi:hypothetical protein
MIGLSGGVFIQLEITKKMIQIPMEYMITPGINKCEFGRSGMNKEMIKNMINNKNKIQ